MNTMIVKPQGLAPMSSAAVAAVANLSKRDHELPQVPLVTKHMFHAGIYSRTILLPKNVRLTGALIKRSTVVTVSGHAKIFVGDRVILVEGYEVFPASAGRKQAYYSYAPTNITMSFATTAKSVEEAEAEFTDEFESLMSHDFENEIIITGE